MTLPDPVGLPDSPPSTAIEEGGSKRPVITPERFNSIVAELRARGFADDDIAWSEGMNPPATAEDFALEAAFVICNSGMKNTVARRIYEDVSRAIQAGASARCAFGHDGKANAIDVIWIRREELFAAYTAAADKLAFCESLPWIGPITKYHLAKNFGADVAKPDVHLQRLADHEGVTVQALCDRLAGLTGYRSATIDLLLWRACAEGVINSRLPADGRPLATTEQPLKSNGLPT